MVERVNGIIKSNTILREHYSTKEEMKTHLFKFLVFYLLYRRHGSLKKELGVKTPFEAIEKWFELKLEIFYIQWKMFCTNLWSLKIKYYFYIINLNQSKLV